MKMKTCLSCNTTFTKPIHTSLKRWEVVKYCSIACSSKAKEDKVYFNCHQCGKEHSIKPSHIDRSEYKFCSKKCFAFFRSNLPKERQPRFGTGHSPEERKKRIKARGILNHYLRDNRVQRPKCEICNEIAEAHHDDYDKPLDVKWLCRKHHRQYHKIGDKIFSNHELLNP